MLSNPVRVAGVLAPHVQRTREGLVAVNFRTKRARFSQQASHSVISASSKLGNTPYDSGNIPAYNTDLYFYSYYDIILVC